MGSNMGGMGEQGYDRVRLVSRRWEPMVSGIVVWGFSYATLCGSNAYGVRSVCGRAFPFSPVLRTT